MQNKHFLKKNSIPTEFLKIFKIIMGGRKINVENEFGQFYSGGPILTIPNSKKIIFQTQNSVSIIDILVGKIESLNLRFRDLVSSISIDKKGKYLLVVDKSSLLTIVHINKKKVKGRLLLPGNSFFCKWSPRNRYFAIAIFTYIQVWKVDKVNQNSFFSFQLSRTYKSHQKQICSLDWHFSGDYFISAGKDGNVKIFSFRKKRNFLEININGFFEKILSIQFFDFSNCVLVLCQHNFLYKIDLFEKKKINKISNFHSLKNSIIEFKLDEKNKTVTSFNLFKLEEVFFLGFSDGSLGLFEVRKKFNKNKNFSNKYFLFKVQNINPFESFRLPISNFSVCQNKNLISLANLGKNRITIFDREKKKIIVLYEKFFENPISMSLSNNNSVIIIGNKNGNVTVWSVKTGFCIIKFSNHLSDVSNILFYKYSSRMAISSSKDGTIKIYDLIRCNVIRTLDCNSRNKSLKLIDINHTGFFIVSCCENTFEIFLWSVKSGILIEQLVSHRSDIIKLSFLKNELKIISCDIDGILKLWIFQERDLKIYDFFCETFQAWGKFLSIDLNTYLSEMIILTENHEIIFFDLIIKKCFKRISFDFSGFLKKKYKNKNNFGQVFINYCKHGKELIVTTKQGYVLFFDFTLKSISIFKFFEHYLEKFFYTEVTRFNLKNPRKIKNLEIEIIDFCCSKKTNLLLILTNFSILIITRPILVSKKKNENFIPNTRYTLSEKTLKFFLRKQKKIGKNFFFEKIKKLEKFSTKKIQKKTLNTFIGLWQKIYFNVQLLSFLEFYLSSKILSKNITNFYEKKKNYSFSGKIKKNHKKILDKVNSLNFCLFLKKQF